jgi:hypothetical protein
VFSASLALDARFVQVLGEAYDAIARLGPLAVAALPDTR